MKTIKSFGFILLLALTALTAHGQQAITGWTTTTLGAAVTSTSEQYVIVAASTGINYQYVAGAVSSGGSGGAPSAMDTYLYVDKELMKVNGAAATATGGYQVKVIRGTHGTKAATHLSGATVWVGIGSQFMTDSNAKSGSCSAGALGPLIAIPSGKMYACAANGEWRQQVDATFFVSPANCTFAPTTLTTTNTLTHVGASTIYVLNGTSNAAAGTNTLVCNIGLPNRVFPDKGAIIWDITLFFGSQTTAPTSVGTATMGTITFPAAAATTETASTVTPVSAGTVTTVYPATTGASVTTAGAFLTSKHSISGGVKLNTDRQILQFTFPFNQSAAAAMTINTPGLLVHYTAPAVD